MEQIKGKDKYRRELNFWHVVFLSTGGILGPAIAFTPVSVLAFGGPAGVVSWFIALLFILPIAFVYVELATMWPRAGGVAYYAQKSSGALVGTLNGWGAFIGYSLVPPVVIEALVEYLSYYYPSLFAHGTLTSLGIVVSAVGIFLIFAINLFRIKRLGDINNILTIISIILIAVFVLALLVHFKASNVSNPSWGGFVPLGASGVFLAVSATVFGYGGFRQPIDYAEEIRDPGKSLPRAILLTLAIVLIIYVLESIAFLGTVNWKALGLPTGDWGGLTSLPYPYVSASDSVALPAIAAVSLIAAIIASFKDGVIYYGGGSRVGHTLARYDRFFPDIFNKMSKQGIPVVSAVVVLVISLIFLGLLPSFASLFPLIVDGLLFSYFPGTVSLAIFRKRNPEVKRPYRLPLYQVTAPLAFVFASLLIFWSGWAATSVLISVVYIGLIFLAIYHRHKKIQRQDITLGIWLPIYMAVILVLSYSSSVYFGGKNIIPFPLDTIVFVIVSFIFYYIAYFSGIRYTGNPIEDDQPSSADSMP